MIRQIITQQHYDVVQRATATIDVYTTAREATLAASDWSSIAYTAAGASARGSP